MMISAQITVPDRLGEAQHVYEICSFAIEEQAFTESQFCSESNSQKLDGQDHFGFAGSVFSELSYGPIGNHNFGLVILQGRLELEHAIPIVESVFLDLDGRQGHIHDAEYYHWQNAHDPLQYEAAGKTTDGLPLIDNGLPPPLNQLIVDTSRNPGRRYLRDGFQEAISSPMWLSKDCCGVTIDLAKLSGAGFTVVDRDRYVVVSGLESPFTKDTGKEQENLRGLLYST